MTAAPSVEQVSAFIHIGMRLLGARMLSAGALLMTFGLFCWAMAAATWISYVIAVSFAVIMYLPTLWRGSASGAPHG